MQLTVSISLERMNMESVGLIRYELRICGPDWLSGKRHIPVAYSLDTVNSCVTSITVTSLDVDLDH